MPPWLDRLRALIARGWEGDDPEAASARDREVEDLARAIHAWQVDRIPVIARLSAEESIANWHGIPAVPVELFAEHDIFAWPIDQATGCFLSSGTTRTIRGRHFHRDTTVYRAACLAGARWALRDDGLGWEVRSLQPDLPESSLASMIRSLAEDLGSSRSGTRRVLLIGPAFAFVEVLDARATEPLPEGSIVVETGGYKGRTRAIERGELHERIAKGWGVPRERIIGEYGMCELSSPLWERVGIAGSGIEAERGYRAAPWVHVRLLDPETLKEAPRGVVAIWDLANWQSSVGILTADLARCSPEGRIILEGRLPGAGPKGCSLDFG